MSEIKVNKISQRSGTAITLGNSGTDFQLPSGADIIAQSGSTITIAAGATITNSGTATGFGATGAVNWDTTPKTTTVTAVSGVGYFVNTTSGAITVNLPAGVAGSIVAISDYANTAATNNIIIDPNGTDKINGVNQDAKITTNGAAITLVYVDATRGWKDINDATLDLTGIPPFVAATGGTILTCGDFKTHVFTGPGTFTVTNAGAPTGSNSVEYVVVAAGGGGGGFAGGGGGAGGFRQNYPSPAIAGLPVTAQGYPITVGSGGAGSGSGGSVCVQLNQTSGTNSIFSTITSAGGGFGATNDQTSPPPSPGGVIGSPGGSGGGASRISNFGTGNSPPTSPPQGNPGGPTGFNSGRYYGTGGGGASAAGTDATPTNAGSGGAGSPIATTFFGPTSPSYGTSGPAPGRYFAGGGGGGINGPGTAGTGGSGGGGAGSNTIPVAGGAGTVNTGGGGGSGGSSSGGPCNSGGGAGGSGIVLIRYKFQ